MAGSGYFGLAGVMLNTTNERWPAMRRFYVEVLGLSPRTDRDGFVSFQWGAPPHDCRLTVTVHSEVPGPTTDPARFLLNLGVDDIEPVARRITAAGGTFLRPPSQEPWGGYVATLADPDGNYVQLMQPAPPGATIQRR
jgi:predicted enzyme related to lactoylglutathione lyase